MYDSISAEFFRTLGQKKAPEGRKEEKLRGVTGRVERGREKPVLSIYRQRFLTALREK